MAGAAGTAEGEVLLIATAAAVLTRGSVAARGVSPAFPCHGSAARRLTGLRPPGSGRAALPQIEPEEREPDRAVGRRSG